MASVLQGEGLNQAQGRSLILGDVRFWFFEPLENDLVRWHRGSRSLGQETETWAMLATLVVTRDRGLQSLSGLNFPIQTFRNCTGLLVLQLPSSTEIAL